MFAMLRNGRHVSGAEEKLRKQWLSPCSTGLICLYSKFSFLAFDTHFSSTSFAFFGEWSGTPTKLATETEAAGKPWYASLSRVF